MQETVDTPEHVEGTIEAQYELGRISPSARNELFEILQRDGIAEAKKWLSICLKDGHPEPLAQLSNRTVFVAGRAPSQLIEELDRRKVADSKIEKVLDEAESKSGLAHRRFLERCYYGQQPQQTWYQNGSKQ